MTVTHRMSNTRLYRIWRSLKERTTLQTHRSYKYYGGRGIRVCKEWTHSFEQFMTWAVLEGYADSLTIDRIDNDKDYNPENCRWISLKENCRNRRSTVLYEGETMLEASIRLGGCHNLVKQRIDDGWSLAKAFNAPIRKRA
ncbi:MAG: hypothetical protein KGI71_06010 [Patescibacteria group bacterium]|nr:hypothetical protein [Patescibacteria group bacterium]